MPVGAILAAVGPTVAKLATSKKMSKGAGGVVRVITSVKNKATDVLTRKATKAQIKAEKAKAEAAQIAALAGGTVGSQDKIMSLAGLETFGLTKEVKKREVVMDKTKNNKQMDQVKEFFAKNWLYVLGGVVALMYFRKRGR